MIVVSCLKISRGLKNHSEDTYLVSERKLVKLIKVPVIASDEGAKQSLNLFELTLEIAPKGHFQLRQKTPRNDRNVPKLSALVQVLI